MENLPNYNHVIEFINFDNKVNDETLVSPSGKYKLFIGQYKTKGENGWNYTCGEIYNSQNELLFKIPRNFPIFHHSFFNKNENEWLVTGINYMNQIFINLDTKQIYYINNFIDDETPSLCWSNSWASNDGNTLAVCACNWGDNYNIHFYDISELSKGWKKLNNSYEYEISQDMQGATLQRSVGMKINEISDFCDHNVAHPSIKNSHWNDDGTFTMYSWDWYIKCNRTNKYYHIQETTCHELCDNDSEEYVDSNYTFTRIGDKMIIINMYESEDRKRWKSKMNN